MSTAGLGNRFLGPGRGAGFVHAGLKNMMDSRAVFGREEIGESVLHLSEFMSGQTLQFHLKSVEGYPLTCWDCI